MPGSLYQFVVALRVPEEWDPEFTRSTVFSALCSDLALMDVVVHEVDNTAKKTSEFINDVRRSAEKILKELHDHGRLDDVSLEHEMLKVVGVTERLWTRLLVMHKELNDARRATANPGS